MASRLKANLLLDRQQLVRPQGGSRRSPMFGSHVIGDAARRALCGEFQHQRSQRRDHEGPFRRVRRIFMDAIEIAAHGRPGLVIDMTTQPLDQWYVADAEAEDEAIII